MVIYSVDSAISSISDQTVTVITSNNTQLCLTCCQLAACIAHTVRNQQTNTEESVSLLQPPRQPQLIYLARVHLSSFMRDIPRTSVQSRGVRVCARDDETQPDSQRRNTVRQTDRQTQPNLTITVIHKTGSYNERTTHSMHSTHSSSRNAGIG